VYSKGYLNEKLFFIFVYVFQLAVGSGVGEGIGRLVTVFVIVGDRFAAPFLNCVFW
jgi:hypothetical protein